MNDTDKYERMLKDETYRLDGRNNMMALTLLAEVKRLREIIGNREWTIKLCDEEIKRLREELFNTHAFYANMEQMLAFAVGIKQGLLTNLSMDDLVDAMNRDYHDRLNEHMDGRLIE